ncbi:MAG: hypothetical protein IPK52_13770 [Chloroflexi bacterium]|nr:hypothetical protein [Chloroflexota bacterium]
MLPGHRPRLLDLRRLLRLAQFVEVETQIVQPRVDEMPHAVPHGVKQQTDHDHARRKGEHRRLRPEQRLNPRPCSQEDRRENRRQKYADNYALYRAVDRQVQIPQPVAHHRDAQRDRHQQQRQRPQNHHDRDQFAGRVGEHAHDIH